MSIPDENDPDEDSPQETTLDEHPGLGHALARYFEHCHRRTFTPRATIISAGAPSSSLYYIVDGSVSVIMEDDSGHEIVLAYLSAGDFFGEIGLFDEKHERSAWVRARTATEVAQLSYDKLRELTHTQPEVLFEMLSQLSLRVRDTSRKLGDLAFHDVAGRIAHALLDLSEQAEARHTAMGIEVEITRQELGRIVGCSREMASRVMRSLEDRDIVTVSGKVILIRKVPALES
jgi:CRP/FNR family cyclic AMP-dependent transcriptional regulator